MIEQYCTQSIGWRQRVEVKNDGEAVHDPAPPADPFIIKGRFEYTRKLILNEKGEQITSEALVLTTAKVNTGDILVWDDREWIVYTVKPVYGLLGKESHREVRL